MKFNSKSLFLLALIIWLFFCLFSDFGTEAASKPHMHNYITVKSPTCTESGLKKCSCGATQTIPALGHDMSKYSEKEIKPATCTETGEIKHTKWCARCGGNIQVWYTTIPLKPHSWKEEFFHHWQATCQHKAFDEWALHCSVCGKWNSTWEVKNETGEIVHHNHIHRYTSGLSPLGSKYIRYYSSACTYGKGQWAMGGPCGAVDFEDVLAASPSPPPPTYNLSIDKTGSGWILVNGSSVNCPYNAIHNRGAGISLQAVPGPGNTFSGWSGSISSVSAASNVTMDSNKSIVANFADVPVINNITVDTGNLWTYKGNKITIATNDIVSRLKISFNKGDASRKAELTLNQDKAFSLSSPSHPASIYNGQLQVSTAGNTRTWVFTFDMKNYNIYPETMFNDNLEVTGHTDMGGLAAPANTNAGIKQTLLTGLRITGVNDIYWKYLFKYSDGSYTGLTADTRGMPIYSNSHNHLISKGYSVQFRIDSEGLQDAGDQITVKPSFWWMGTNGQYREVDLYYDVQDLNIFNIPIHDPADNTGLQNKINMIKSKFPGYWTSNIYANSFNGGYGRMTVNPAPIYLENRVDIQDYLISGRFKSEAEPANQYKHTWSFTYSIHPYTKAVPKGENPVDNPGLKGCILVVLKITTYKAKDSSCYNYCKFESKWGGGSTAGINVLNGPAQNFDPGISNPAMDIGALGGKVMFFNLDKSVIDDYTLQNIVLLKTIYLVNNNIGRKFTAGPFRLKGGMNCE